MKWTRADEVRPGMMRSAGIVVRVVDEPRRATVDIVTTHAGKEILERINRHCKVATFTAVRKDGTTTCCGAYTSIFQDDGVEYCKKCYDEVEVLI